MGYTAARMPSVTQVFGHTAIATNANDIFGSFKAPFPGQMVYGSLNSVGNVTANNTNYTTFSAVANTTAMATADLTLTGSGNSVGNLTADTPVAMVLNSTLASKQFAAATALHVWANFTAGGLAVAVNWNVTMSLIYDVYDLA